MSTGGCNARPGGPRGCRRAPGFLLCLFVAATAPGCFFGRHGEHRSFPEHVVADLDHPWHTIPSQVVALPVVAVTGACVLPMTPLEYWITGRNPVSRHRPGVLLSGAGYIALSAGFVVGLPFYLLALPFGAEEQGGAGDRSPVEGDPAADPVEGGTPIPP